MGLAAPWHGGGSSPRRDPTRVSCIGRQDFYHWATREEALGFCEAFGCLTAPALGPHSTPFPSRRSSFVQSCAWVLWAASPATLLVLNHPCIPVVNLNCSWCVTLLTYCWIWFVNILFSIFASIFIGGINLSLSLLWYSWIVGQWSYNSLWNEWIQYSFKITCKHEFSFRIAKTTYTWVA